MGKRWTEQADSDLLAMYYEGTELAEVARTLGRTRSAVKNRLAKIRGVRRQVHACNVGHELDAERGLITELKRSGMTCRELAAKFECGESTMQAKLAEWGLTKRVKNLDDLDDLERMKLADLPYNWAEVDEKTVITVAKVPRFVLVPIAQIPEATINRPCGRLIVAGQLIVSAVN